MKRIIILGGLLIGVSFQLTAGNISKAEYISKWKSLAIEQMISHQIPASITLAQAILESGSGNSKLAKEANNHFGIKCGDWSGKKYHMDDDSDRECFRVYKEVKDSYLDHSDFLASKERYAVLFTYDIKDYRAWAKGLKKAGYATNPAYPELLIELIEGQKLYEFDELAKPEIKKQPKLVASNANPKPGGLANKHDVFMHDNKVKYVIAKKGDTYYLIAKEFGLTLKQLHKYNSFEEHKDFLVPGDVIYIHPKKRGNLFVKEVSYLEKEMTLIELSQTYAVHVKTLRRLNELNDGEQTVAKGEKIILR